MSATHEPSPASLARHIGGHRGIAIFALCALAVAGVSGDTFAQDSDQQIRCIQLQQELASAQSGAGNGAALAAINKQIQDTTRVYQGTKAAMEDAGCFQSFLIFGRSLARTPNCLKMNDRAENAQRQLDQLQGQRDAMAGGGGNRRRQAELMDALARNGCSGGKPVQQQARRDTGGGGFFGWFGRGSGDEEQPGQPEQPVYRSIDPNGRYRSVCVRTCDGFFFPISYQTYANRLSQDATVCQSSCAAPAELYVYRNESFGGAIKMPLLLDNTAIGDTAPHTYVFKEVTPGKHTIVSKTENDVSLDINAQPGQTYYVWQEVKMGVWTARSALHQMDEKTGQQAVKDCKLIQ